MARGIFDFWHKTRFFAFLLLLAITAIVYAPTLANGFTLDDAVIFDAAYPRSLADGWRLLFEPVSSRTVSFYRPLAFFSFVADYALWRENPFGYHLSNIVLAALVCFAVFLLAKHLLTERQALLAAVFFAVLPGHSEAVINVYNRSQMLSSLFMLLSLVFLAKILAKQKASRTYTVLACLTALLACMGKESGIVTPALAVLLICWYRPPRRLWLHLAGAVMLQGVACLSYLLLRYQALDSFSIPGIDWFLAEESAMTRFFTSGYVFSKYLQLAFFPVPLSCDYPIEVVSFHFPALLYPLLVVLSLVGLVQGNERQRLCSFCFLWFVMALAPVLHILPLQVSVAERVLHPASFAVAVFLAVVISLLPKRNRTWGIVVVALLAVLTFRRCFDWRNDDTLWRKTLSINPDSYRARIYLGNQWMREKQWQKALEQYQHALFHRPNATNRLLIYTNAAQALFLLERPGDARRVLEDALQLDPNYPPALLLLAQNAQKRGQWQEASYFYKQVLTHGEGWPVPREAIWQFLATFAYRQRQWGEAIHYYQKLPLDSFDALQTRRTFIQLGQCHANLAQWGMAQKYYLQAIEIAEDYPALVQLATTELQMEQYQQAHSHIQKALFMEERPYQAQYLLALWHLYQGESEKAAKEYATARQLLPQGIHLPPLEK